MKALADQIRELDGIEVYGRVIGVRGLMVEVAGPIHTMSVGARVLIETGQAPSIPCEVGGFSCAHSVLLSMLARNVNADVSVIGLVGERGREVQEFLQDDLGPEGLRRSVVVVATSDEPALMRRQAAYLTLAIAEYFRDADQDVLVLM